MDGNFQKIQFFEGSLIKKRLSKKLRLNGFCFEGDGLFYVLCRLRYEFEVTAEK